MWGDKTECIGARSHQTRNETGTNVDTGSVEMAWRRDDRGKREEQEIRRKEGSGKSDCAQKLDDVVERWSYKDDIWVIWVG